MHLKFGNSAEKCLQVLSWILRNKLFWEDEGRSYYGKLSWSSKKE